MKEINIILLISLTIYGHCETTMSDNKTAIWKCCPKNQVLDKESITCKNATNIEIPEITIYSSNLKPTNLNLFQHFNVVDSKIVGIDNPRDEYTDPKQLIGMKVHLIEDSSLKLLLSDVSVLVPNIEFCFDYKSDDVVTPIFIVKNHQPVESMSVDITTGIMFMSCVFLFLVLVIYLIIEETRNLIGLSITTYVFCFLNGLLVLAINRLGTFGRIECKVTTYYIYFFLLATFFWMNVISYDIWSMSRSYIQSNTRNQRRKWIQFMRYAAYAFGVPTVLTILMFVFDNVDMRNVKWFVTPDLEHATCFFNGAARLIYLYIPILLLILCNTVFYILTGCTLHRHYKATSMLKCSGDSGVTRRQRQRLWMFIKLSVVMGLNWVFEVISAVFPDWTGWYITDIFNLLVGVSIFVIFVCKKKIITKLMIKLGFITAYEIQGRKNRNDSTTMSSQDGSMQMSPNADTTRYEF